MEETPWAAVQRLRSEGASFDTIILTLQERGLSRDDLETLLKDDPAFLRWSRGQPEQKAAVVTAPPPPPSPPTDTGKIVRWTVITLSALASGFLAAGARTGLGLGLMALALLPAIALLVVEFKKGTHRTARGLAFVLFFAFIFPSLAGFIGGWDPPQLLSAALFLLSVPLLIWASRTGEKLKGLSALGLVNVFESGEVQFSVGWSAEPVGPGESVEVMVHAQNCVDVPRSLLIKVRGDLRSHLAPFEHTVKLDPGCIVEVLVPVRVPPLAPERFGFTIDFVGTGDATGRRVRLAKGAEWVTPAESLATNLLGAATLAGAGLGVFRLGSNGSITVKVDTEKPHSSTERKVEVKELYRPEPAVLTAAATS